MIDEKRKFADMYLAEGETIHWYGKPQPSISVYLKSSRMTWIILGIAALVSLVWFFFLIQDVFQWLTSTAMVGVPIVALLLINRHQFRQSVARTRYMITNQRIMVFDTESSFHQGFNLDELEKMNLLPIDKTYSSLQFGNQVKLYAIEDAQQVKTIVEKLIDEVE